MKLGSSKVFNLKITKFWNEDKRAEKQISIYFSFSSSPGNLKQVNKFSSSSYIIKMI